MKLLKDLLDEFIILDEEDEIEDGDYERALYYLLCGGSLTPGECESFLKKWFINPIDIVDKSEDCEDLEVLNIDNSELEVLLFSDGYEGYILKLSQVGDKLDIIYSRKVVDEDDSVFDRDSVDINDFYL